MPDVLPEFEIGSTRGDAADIRNITGTVTNNVPVFQPLGLTSYVDQVSARDADNSKCFMTTTNLNARGTVESPFYLIQNPAASGKTIKILKSALFGAGTFRFYYFPTVTAVGTSLLQVNRKAVSGATQGSVALSFANPTVSANGNLLFTFYPAAQVGTALIPFLPELILPPGASMVVTTLMAANSTQTSVGMEWSELP